MTGNELRTVIDFEKGLASGAPVRVCWTNSHRFFRGAAEVVRVNAKSIRVRLTERVTGTFPFSPAFPEGYPVGREIVVPLITDERKWSCYNHVEPAGGYPALPEQVSP